jgi:hypothetical protein
MFVYALQLVSNKYYIDITSISDDEKILEHAKKSEWVKQYQPILIKEMYHSKNLFEEDNLTKKYMLEYGIENVRGGAYSKIQLEEWQIKALEYEFKLVTNGNYTNDTIINNKYLDQFTSEEALEIELIKTQKIRHRLLNEANEIDDLKYVRLQMVQKEQPVRFLKVEIEPSIIDKYGARNYKGDETNVPWNIASEEDITIEILYKGMISKDYFQKTMFPYNVVENIYKIYVIRVKKEKQLTKLLKDNDCFDTDFDKSIIILNKRIEMLYEKYATMI